MRRLGTIFVLSGVVFCAAVTVIAAGQPGIDAVGSHEPGYLVPRQPAVKSSRITVGAGAEIKRVIVKLAEGSRGRLSGGRIYSVSGRDVAEINRIISRYSGRSIRHLTQKSPDEIERERYLLERKSGHRLADMNNYFAVPVPSAAEAEELVNRLNRLPQVEIAYPEPIAEPAVDLDPPTPDYDTAQVYLRPAPDGIDADYSRTVTGGDGSGVRIIDIEGNWKFDHEDLELSPDRHFGGELIENTDWRNHGTAVVGVMIGGDNGYGITGIVPNADIGMVSIGGIGAAEAILIAADSLQPGDIMVIEVHAAGPRYNFEPRTDQLGYVCMEYWQAEFDAIQLAWAMGIIVCEAAGNGAENLDDVIYENRFDTTERNSHAIMIGAGAPPSGNNGVDRSRIPFSNYGERVNLQGYGREVVTLGYGYLFNGGGDERQYYMNDFGGTSGAAPIVAGGVAALQGIYRNRYGIWIDADRVRDVLIATGSPQQFNPYQHIGPRPNLKAADSALPAPPDLSVDPLYFDTAVELGTQATVSFDLINHSATTMLEYSITTTDSVAKGRIDDWLTVTNPTGVISPSGLETIDVVFDASVLEDRTQVYKGTITIQYGVSGGSLDEQAVVPVFVTVPCADTLYSVKTSSDPDGPVFDWIDITTSGLEVPVYAWYNPFVESEIIDDGSAGPFTIGFDFPFYENSYTKIFIGANGGISVTDTNINVDGFFVTVPIPNPPFETFISPFWNDLNMDPDAGGHGTVYYYRSWPRDTMIILYHQVGNYNDPNDTLTSFEIVLTKNGNIVFQYLSVGATDLADSAVVGIAEYDCRSVPYAIQGIPPEHIVTDNFAIQFDYALAVREMAGDINSDGDINVADAVYLINYIFKGGPAPLRMMEADLNCDGNANISDAVYIVNYVFKSGPEPCEYEL